jgi:predicted PurR-regulated permease PerM
VPATHSDHKINKYFFLAIILLFGVFIFFSLIQFFSAFLGAVMFYVLSKSSMEKLIKRKWKKSWAAVVIIILSFFIILLPLSIVGIMLFEKAKLFLAQPDIIVKTLSSVEKNINARYHIKIFSEQNIASIQSIATSAVTSILNQGLNFIAAITMMYFFLYFMLININRMEAAIVFFLPFQRSKIALFGRELISQTFSNSVVVPLIALVQGLLAFIAYLITSLPEAGFWAIISGFASIIPIVGTGLVWIPATVYLFITGHTWQGFFLLTWGAAILGSADNIIRFLMARRMADTHPVITVLGVIIGLQFFGLPGLIFGPLLISYFVILLRIYYLEYQSLVPPVKRKKNIPIRFNLPFIGNTKPTKKK